MPFKYRYQVLLQHREYLNRKAQTALAVAQRSYEAIELRQSSLREEILQVRRLWEQEQAEGINVSTHLSFRDYLASLEQQLLTVGKALEKALQEVELARKAVIEKEKDVKMLESLKEHEKDIYRVFEIKKEQKKLDEAAVVKDYHKKSDT